ncbi:MAG: ABC transporter substrate-binding protein [Myxococcota bacterium]
MLLWLVVSGCSFTRFGYTPCEAPVECRDAFGFGSTCGDDGYCRAVEPLARCGHTNPPDLLDKPEKYADAIVFASVFDSAYDYLEEQAAELAVIGVNAQNGLDGVEYGIIQCDYNADGTTDFDNDEEDVVVERIGKWLHNEVGVTGLVGSSTSASTQVLYPFTGERGVLMISPSATSPALTYLDGVQHTDDDPGLLWRTVPSDAAQAVAIAQDMAARNVQSVGVIAVTGAYGEGLANAFLDAYSGDGRRIDIYTYDETDTVLLGDHLQSVAAGGYDEALYIGSTVRAVAGFLNGAATFATFQDGETGIFLTDAARYDSLFEDAAPAAALYPYVRGTSPAAPSGPVYESFRGAFASQFGGDSADGSIYTSYAFDAAWLMIYGSAWSAFQEGEVTGVGMAKGLRHLSAGDDVPIRTTSWTTVTANFEAGQSVDIEGASGPLDFDPQTEETTNAVDVWVIDGAAFTNVDRVQ